MKRIAQTYLKAYSGLSGGAWWLSLVMLVNRSGTMVVPFLALYLTEAKHYTIAQAGQVLSVYGMGAICGGFLGGKLTDKIGYYATLILTLTSGGILFIVLGQMQDMGSICGVAFLLAMLNDAFRPANSSAIAAWSKPENRTRSFSLNRLAINLGWALGGAMGGFVAAHNYQLLFWIDGATNIGAALILWAVLKPKPGAPKPHKLPKDPTTKPAFRDRTFMWFVVLTIIYGSCFFQHFSTIPLFYRRIFHLDPSFIGLTMALNGLLIVVFEMALVYRLEARPDHSIFIASGMALTGLGFVLFNVVPGGMWLAITFTLLLTLAEMLSMPFMNTFWVRRTNDQNRGGYAGWYSAAWSIAQVAGPYLGSQTAQHAGFATLWWIVAGVSLAGALGFVGLGRSRIA